MKILHYSLGWPPYRTGGLTKYCIDIMYTQKELGNEVALIWPGKMQFVNSEVNIKQRKDIDGIKSFEIINPLPVPLLDGISEIEAYTKNCSKKVFIEFLKIYKPDVIHIHTFMGIYKEFLEVAKELNIYVVFTTHDYFGICPKVNLLKNNKPCDKDNNCNDCIACNSRALSIKRVKILQSPLYRKLKNIPIVKELRRNHKHQIEEVNTDKYNGKNTREDYIKLRNYYVDMFKYIDKIHFNSSLTKSIYARYIDISNGEVYPITHKAIKDNRKIRKYDEKLKITYLGPAKAYKGFYLLKDTLDKIYKNNKDKFELNIFSIIDNPSPYMNMKDRYKYEELESIFNKTDVLVAPSIWYETFGFTVLEALSYGVPVIVSNNVGAKDIVGDFGYIIKPNAEELTDIILKLIDNKTELINKNKNIVNYFDIKLFDIKNNVSVLMKMIYRK